MSRTSRTAAILLVICGLSLAACNTDWMWRMDRPPQGPVTSASNPEGIPSDALVDELSMVDAAEVDLVEQVLTHRANYHRSLRMLHDYYREHGIATKEAWAAYELKGLDGVMAFRYVLDSEVPAALLKPEVNIAEANALYERAQELMRQGGRDVRVVYRRELMIKAARVLRQLIADYPNSDKIDDAAFFLGELHKDYFKNQDAIAVRWYERAWAWDPETPHPARFEAARIYDYRLHDRDRALELYQSVLDHETSDQGNVRTAARRISELTSGRRTADARP